MTEARTLFYADALTEDRMETVFECWADTREDARTEFELAYPDCRIKRIYSAAEAAEEEGARYRRLTLAMDY